MVKIYILYPEEIRKEYWQTAFEEALKKAGINIKQWKSKIYLQKRKIKEENRKKEERRRRREEKLKLKEVKM